ncbi:MAG: OmpA family protein [Candidatus Kapabacteria bacterium]|jgi:outer membrane protein OmpA-like peptidoglycan-associated protein|nr:OmpA family protein [Candidatus Kapabacteria bacterium]
MRNLNNLKIIIVMILVLLISGNTAYSQSEGGRMSFGFNAGGVKYWGEFTDNQFWLGGDLFFRYNLIPQVSFMAVAGLAQSRYKVSQGTLDKYPDYFGVDAEIGNMYPNSNIRINDKNSVRLSTYELYVTYNLFPHEKFVPYIFTGAGLLNWESSSGDSGFDGPLPNNANQIYEKNILAIPVGIGFEVYLSDNIVLNARGTYRFVDTDYLDDYASAGSDNDAFLTFGMGFSYYIIGDADLDKDGLTNDRERALGTDPRNPDTDGEGLLDGEEVDRYHTNPLLVDTDKDGLNDFDELMKHKSNPLNPDSDGDGLNDGQELVRKTDMLKADTDNDGLLDGEEVNVHSTDPKNSDTDEDGLNDGDEFLKYNTNMKSKDSDTDGLEDGAEVKTHKTNPIIADSDNDGLLDGLEVNQYKTDPIKPDTDEDGLNDGDEVNKYSTDPLKTDSDNDGLNDGDEVRRYKTNPLSDDSDVDGLKDGDEVNKYKTDPINPDSDNDGLKDGDEVLKYKTDPANLDTDGDVLNDGEEVLKYKTSPIRTDTDIDKLDDGTEVNKVHSDPLNPDTDGDKVIDGDDDCPLIAGDKSNEKGKNGCPSPPKVGTKTDFNDILFVVNTDNFNFDMPGTAMSLAKMLAYVKQCDPLRVLIEGHASAEGDSKRNQTLSESRAARVKQWLILQGVGAEKITGTIGYGSSDQKIKEPTGRALKKMSKKDLEALRKQNRRITIKVIETCK